MKLLYGAPTPEKLMVLRIPHRTTYVLGVIILANEKTNVKM